MGALLVKLWKKLFSSNHSYKILMLGLSNAGKTTILYKLNLGTVIETHPTIGGNVEEIEHKNVKFTVWDLGGQESIRSVWQSYFDQTDAVIYVIDSSEEKQKETNKIEFNKLLQEPVMNSMIAYFNQQLKNAQFLIFANKQDLEGCMNMVEITNNLELGEIKSHQWKIQQCSAIKGQGLYDGLDWLVEQININKK